MAGVAHQIKNPLVAIKTLTELLSNNWDNKVIRDKCKNVVLPQLGRINQLLDSFFGMKSASWLNFEPINLSIETEASIPLIRANSQSNVSIHTEIESEIWVLANKGLIQQVVLNLAINAIDALNEFKESPMVTIRVYSKGADSVLIYC